MNKILIVSVLMAMTISGLTLALDSDNDGYDFTIDCDDENPLINPGATEIACNLIDEDCYTGTYDYFIQDDSFSHGSANYLSLTFDTSDNSFWVLNDDSASGSYDSMSSAGAILPHLNQFQGCEGISDDPRDNTIWMTCGYVVDLDPTLDGYNLSVTRQIVHFDKSSNVLGNIRIDNLGAENPIDLVFDPRDDSFWVLDGHGYWTPSGDYFIYHIDSEGNNLSDGFKVRWDSLSFALDLRDYSFWVANEFFGVANVEHYDSQGNLISKAFNLEECNNPMGFTFDPRDGSFWCLQDNVFTDYIYHFSNTGAYQGTDNDGDGFMIEEECGLVDCDDANRWIHPGATLYVPLCSTQDWDCDGLINEDYISTSTTCGVGECANNVGAIECIDGEEIDTCNPFEPAVQEICNNFLDDDCDGEIDEDCGVCGNGICEGYLKGEDCLTCPSDCGIVGKSCCGNGICEKSENLKKCYIDCI